MMHLTAA